MVILMISLQLDLILFRVVQEACRNVYKHAQATKIEIDIKINNKDIMIRL